MLFNNPISSAKVNRLISLLDLPANACALDAGCGRGEFLIRVIEATGATGLGIDSDPQCIAAANESAAERLTRQAYEFRVSDLQRTPLQANSFDLSVCLGATHAFGAGEAAYPNTIQSLSHVVRPGGVILVGEGYWKQPPDPEYLQLIGEPIGIYHTHAENIAFAEQRGLVPLYAAVSSDDEWDDFEWSHKLNIERAASLQPHDPVVQKKLHRSRQWRNGYLQWGRSTMGFGFYLFLKPLPHQPDA